MSIEREGVFVVVFVMEGDMRRCRVLLVCTNEREVETDVTNTSSKDYKTDTSPKVRTN